MNLAKRDGFTYTEILLTLPIILISIFAAAAALMGSLSFNQTARFHTQAMNFGIWRMEQIRSNATLDPSAFRAAMLSFNNRRYPPVIPAQGDVNTMQSLGLDPTGMEVISRAAMLSPTADIADVTVLVCYRDKGGRVVGEDRDFDGALDAGEDRNGNGGLDSPIMFRSMVARK
jgi:hypothetical protein